MGGIFLPATKIEFSSYVRNFSKKYRINEEAMEKTVEISIFYSATLREITNVPFEQVKIPEGSTFADFLNSLFTSYPEIPKRFPPGRLGFLLNNTSPDVFTVLRDGDRVNLVVVAKQYIPSQAKIEEMQNQIENQLTNLIQEYDIDIDVEQIKEIIYNEKDIQELYTLKDIFSEKIDDLAREKEAFSLLVTAWDFFPHKSLGGSCPVEMPSKLQQGSI